MANKPYGQYLYGLSDIKITDITGTTQEDLDAAVELEFEPLWSHGVQEGDDEIKAVVTILKGGQGKFSAGSYSSAAVALMTGKTLTVTSTSPTEVATLEWEAGDSMPYFKIYGKAIGPDGDDLHVLIPKAKLSGGGAFTLSHEEFLSTGFEFIAVSDGTKVVGLVQNETADDLPAPE